MISHFLFANFQFWGIQIENNEVSAVVMLCEQFVQLLDG